MAEVQTVLILDFGSQYTQLIARRIRELGVHSEIHPYSIGVEGVKNLAPKAVVLSGGPASCYDDDAPSIEKEVYDLGLPVLGICYGAQLTAKLLGGKVEPADHHEYGHATIKTVNKSVLTASLPESDLNVWMSHGDKVSSLPQGFETLYSSANCQQAAFANPQKNIYCLQFHPEVVHTEKGIEYIKGFVFDVAKVEASWTMSSFAEKTIATIQKQVGPNERVICGLSGGVDSSVVAALLHKAIGSRLTCIFVDNGLLRAGERDHVAKVFREHFKVDLRVIDAEDRFLDALDKEQDPEKKRKIIGREFIRVFEKEASSVKDAKFLAQGTLYPDVIESVSFKGGPSQVIKSHHNVGGLPDDMKFELVEPLRELFKDEVRALGLELGLPKHMVNRQPFPGPGLAVRCLGELKKSRLDTLRSADSIIEQEIVKAGLYESIWQSFGVLLPVRSVGVMGDKRTYAETIALRAVHSNDGMTAEWCKLPYELLGTISSRIINEVRGVNRVVYDITTKPPGTIEWE